MATRRALLPLKITGIIVGAVLGLVVLAAAALPFILDSPLLGKILTRVSSKYLDADLAVGDVRLIVRSYPDVTLDVSDLSLVYPHDRFEGMAEEGGEGRGPVKDTLLSLPRLHAKADARSFIKSRDIHVSVLEADGLRAFLHAYDSAAVNWDIVRLPESDSDTSSFYLGELKLDTLVLQSPRVVYDSAPDTLAASVRLARLAASGLCRPVGDSSFVRACLDITDLDANELIRTAGASFTSFARDVETDALVSLHGEMEDMVRLDSLDRLPRMSVSLAVPESRISYADVVRDARVHIDAAADNSSRGMLDVNVEEAGLHMPGLDLDGFVKVHDLMGRDPKYTLDVDGRAVIQKLLSFLPESLSDLSASGTLDLCVKGTVRQSQMSMEKIADSDLSGHVTGDCIRVRYPSQDIDAYVLRPDFRLTTFKSLLDDSGKQATVTARIDSIDFDMGAALCAQGRNLSLFAQNSSKSINDDFRYKPFSGKVKADRLFLRGADSLGVYIADTDNLFTLTKGESNSQSVPRLRLNSRFGRVFLKSRSVSAALRDASLSAEAQTRARRQNADTAAVRRRFRRPAAESEPDYLSEKEFRTADFSFRLDKSLSDLILKWNPSMTFNVNQGMVRMPAFPLRNRFSHLHGSFSRDVLALDSLGLWSGSSDLLADVRIEGLKRMATRGGDISLTADLRSHHLNLNELLSAVQTEAPAEIEAGAAESDGRMVDDLEYEEEFDMADTVAAPVDSVPELAYSLIIIPANINASVDLAVDSISYSSLLLRGVKTRAEMKERCLQLLGTEVQTDMGGIGLDAFYSTRTKKDIRAGFDLTLTDVTAENVIQLMPAMDEMLPMLKSFKGDLNCTVAATTRLDTNMNILIPTMNGMFRISGKNLLLEDIGSLRKLTDVLMFKDKRMGRIDDMSVYGIVADNELEIFPFVMSVDRYTLALSGMQDFSTGFDYHMSVLKSPLPFKIGLNIYGPDFSRWKYRLTKPLYKSVKVPLYTDQVDALRSRLSTSIREVFARGVDHALQEAREAQAVIAAARKEDGDGVSGELLSAKEMYEIEEVLIAQEIEDETEAINREIEELLKNF